VLHSGVFLTLIASQNILGLLGFGKGLTVSYLALVVATWIPWFTAALVLLVHRPGAVYGQFVHGRVQPLVGLLLFILELLTFFTRLVSLVVRMFANACAGHVLLSLWAFLLVSWLGAWTGIVIGREEPLDLLHLVATSLVFLIVAFVVALELAVAMLQGYIANTLLGSFMAEARLRRRDLPRRRIWLS
jgi:F-type H+-transporting ATPase subunit a